MNNEELAKQWLESKGWVWYDTESAAREVARMAVEDIQKTFNNCRQKVKRGEVVHWSGHISNIKRFMFNDFKEYFTFLTNKKL